MNCRCAGLSWKLVLQYCDSWAFISFTSLFSHMFLLKKKKTNQQQIPYKSVMEVFSCFIYCEIIHWRKHTERKELPLSYCLECWMVMFEVEMPGSMSSFFPCHSRFLLTFTEMHGSCLIRTLWCLHFLHWVRYILSFKICFSKFLLQIRAHFVDWHIRKEIATIWGKVGIFLMK